MKNIGRVIIFSILISAIAACSNFSPTPTETPSPSPTSLPTLTHTPEPTRTPTETPVPATNTPFPPEFSNLQLALDYDKKTFAPQSVQNVFPLGIGYLAVLFDYKVPEKTELFYSIYQNDKAIIEPVSIWVDSGAGTMAFPIRKEYGFQDEGTYEIRISKDEQTILSKPFEITWIPTIWTIQFSESIDLTGKVNNPTTVFSNGTKYVFAFFEMANIKVGDKIKKEWLLDGKTYQESVYVWDNSEWSLGKHADKLKIQSQDKAALPIGIYEFRVYVNGELKQSATLEIK